MSRRVMIIDDDASILEAVQMLLVSEGYEVRTCTDGDCLLRRPEYDPDVVLLDLLLSGRDGRQVVQEIRKVQSLENTPVIIMSAHTLREEDTRVAGAQEFLPKPFDIDRLLEIVKKYTS